MYQPPSPSPSPSPQRYHPSSHPTSFPSYGSRLGSLAGMRAPFAEESLSGRPLPPQRQRLPSFAQSFGQIPAPPPPSPPPLSTSTGRSLPPLATLFHERESQSFAGTRSRLGGGVARGGTHPLGGGASSVGRAGGGGGKILYHHHQQQQGYQQLPTPDPPSPFSPAETEHPFPFPLPFQPQASFARSPSEYHRMPSSTMSYRATPPPPPSTPSRPLLPPARRIVSTPLHSSTGSNIQPPPQPYAPHTTGTTHPLLRPSFSFSSSLLTTGSSAPAPLPLPKLFACPTCSLRFARKNDLVRHERIHTGETPFYCGKCGMGFKRSDARKRHENRGEC